MFLGIDWKKRIKSKTFWLALIPALVVLVQCVAALFGFTLSLDALQQQVLDIVNAVFILLAIFGIAVDTSTPGITDGDDSK